MQKIKINRAEIVDCILRMQPRLIRQRILDDQKFCANYEVNVDRLVTPSEGPSIPEKVLYETVRLVFVDGQPKSFKGEKDEIIHVSLAENRIVLSYKSKDGNEAQVTLMHLMLLSPDAKVRCEIFDKIRLEYGPTGPDPKHWEPVLQQRPLNNDEVLELLVQIENTVPAILYKIQKEISSGSINKKSLVPRSASYWKHLCPAAPSAMKQEDWILNVLRPHQQQLINRDLVRGLEICLAMNLSDQLMPRDLLENVSNDDLWDAVQSILPLDNPMSLVGIVDLAASRADSDKRFIKLAEQNLTRLCAERFIRADGLDVYSYYQPVIDFVVSELQTIPGIASMPAYWRRICGWTQVGLLMRIISGFSFDPEEISNDFSQMHSRESMVAELIDISEAPLWSPMNTSPIAIRAEIIARLKILLDRETDQGRKMPGSDILIGAFENFQKEVPLLTHMPGPLEVHKLPNIKFSDFDDEKQTELRELVLALKPDFSDRKWLNLLYLSRLLQLDAPSLSKISELIYEIKFGNTDNERHDTIKNLGLVCLVAVEQRHFPIAEAILTRCLREVSSKTSYFEASSFVRMGLIAVSALGDSSERTDRLAGYLLNLARLLPKGDAIRAFCDHVEDLKILTPVTEWRHFSRAEAVGMLGAGV